MARQRLQQAPERAGGIGVADGDRRRGAILATGRERLRPSTKKRVVLSAWSSISAAGSQSVRFRRRFPGDRGAALLVACARAPSALLRAPARCPQVLGEPAAALGERLWVRAHAFDAGA